MEEKDIEIFREEIEYMIDNRESPFLIRNKYDDFLAKHREELSEDKLQSIMNTYTGQYDSTAFKLLPKFIKKHNIHPSIADKAVFRNTVNSPRFVLAYVISMAQNEYDVDLNKFFKFMLDGEKDSDAYELAYYLTYVIDSLDEENLPSLHVNKSEVFDILTEELGVIDSLDFLNYMNADIEVSANIIANKFINDPELFEELEICAQCEANNELICEIINKLEERNIDPAIIEDIKREMPDENEGE